MADELGAGHSRRRSVGSGGIIKTGNNISRIIEDLIWEILIRLPADSIHRFRTVCKSWRKLIDSPSFIKSQVNKTAAGINIDSRRLIVFPNRLGIAGAVPKLHCYVVFPSPGNLKVASVKELDYPFNDDYLVGTCNGLICLECIVNFDSVFALWNPCTGNHRIVPDESNIGYLRRVTWVEYRCYFGYDHAKDDYHVISVTRPCNCRDFIFIAVYSLKNDSWTKIRTKDEWCIKLRIDGVYLSGTLYMDTLIHCNKNILAFDISTQRFRLVELPPSMNNVDSRQTYIIGELQGRLCIIIKDGVLLKNKHVLWLMRNDVSEDDVRGGGMNKQTLWKRIDFETWEPVWIDKLLGVLPPASAYAYAEEEELLLVVMARYLNEQSIVEIGMGWCDHKTKSTTTHVSIEGSIRRLTGSDACFCLTTIASPFIV